VAYDTLQSALSRSADVVIIDTAGRLHTKSNLMEELKKIKRVMSKLMPDAPHEVLLVLDATTGQNAIQQAKQFGAAVDVTGLAVTKLDGTAKGGVVLAIADRLKLPVRWVGVGESEDDLLPFSAGGFVDSLLDMEPGNSGTPGRTAAEGRDGGLM
jgi:fused signal recognition particle receptor